MKIHTARAATLLACMGVGCGATTGASSGEPPHEGPTPPIAIALRFEEAGAATTGEVDTGGEPQTRIVLVVIDPQGGRDTAVVGTYAGICSHGGGEGRRGVLLSARCWWLGRETIIQVSRQDESLVAVATRAGDESGDDQATVRLPLDPDARLTIIGPTIGATPRHR